MDTPQGNNGDAGSIPNVEKQLSEMEAQIKRVEEEIAAVARQLVPLSARAAQGDATFAGSTAETMWLMLMKKEEQLRREKEQLRTKEELVLRRQVLILEEEARVSQGNPVDAVASGMAKLSVAHFLLQGSTRSTAASGFVASKSTELKFCCVLSRLYPFCQPKMLRKMGKYVVGEGDLVQAMRVLGDAVVQPPHSTSKVSETGAASLSSSSHTVQEVIVPMLDRLLGSDFVARLAGTAGGVPYAEVPLSEYCALGMASPASKADGVKVVLGSKVPLLFLEAKNTATAPLEQMAQAYAVASNGLVSQLNAGLEWDKCVVLTVSTNGVLYQFGCATLLASRWCNFQPLTGVLDASVHLKEVCEWMLRFRQFLREQALRIRESTPHKVVLAEDGETKGSVIKWELSASRYHLKPADRILFKHQQRDSTGWNLYMENFSRLWACKPLRPYVVFPLGIARSTLIDGVVFERLSDREWCIGVPPPHLRHAYVRELRVFLGHLRDARLVHMDLMPCNIAWRTSAPSGTVALKVLDFDTMCSLDESPPPFLAQNANSLTKDVVWKWPWSLDANYDWWYLFIYERLCTEAVEFQPTGITADPESISGTLLPFCAYIRDHRRLLDEAFDAWLAAQ